MKDRLSIIQNLNTQPLGLLSKRLLQSAKQEISETELYLTQAAQQAVNNPQMALYLQENLNEKSLQKLHQNLEALPQLYPQQQIQQLMNQGLPEQLLQEK